MRRRSARPVARPWRSPTLLAVEIEPRPVPHQRPLARVQAVAKAGTAQLSAVALPDEQVEVVVVKPAPVDIGLIATPRFRASWDPHQYRRGDSWTRSICDGFTQDARLRAYNAYADDLRPCARRARRLLFAARRRALGTTLPSHAVKSWCRLRPEAQPTLRARLVGAAFGNVERRSWSRTRPGQPDSRRRLRLQVRSGR